MAEPVAESRAPKPGVWTWYLVYCGLMAASGLALAAGGCWVLLQAPLRTTRGGDPMVAGIVMLVLGLVFAAPFVAAFLLPRAPWAWSYHLVLICLGLPTTCCMAFSLPMLLVWLEPRTKALFGRP